MKVLFLVPYPTEGASNRYRIEQYLPFLEKVGIKYSVRPFWSKSAFKVLYKKGYFFKKAYFFILGTLFRILDIWQAYSYDIIFIHREIYPIFSHFFETILSILRRPLILDFDDAIFLPSKSDSNTFIERFKNPEKIAKIIAMSKYIIVGNNYLAEFSLRFNKNVMIISTPIDTDKYCPAAKTCKDEIIIGWIGSATTLGFLSIIKGVFIKLSEKYPNIKFKIVGGDFFINGLSNVLCKSWALAGEIDDLGSFDIGIMPMPDNEWTRGKCGFKAILYMSMAIPCVCSPVGMNKEIVTDGINGFLAEKEDEWIKKLSLLIENVELRKRIGIAGRKTIEERYSVKINASKFLDVINKVYYESKRGKAERWESLKGMM